METKLTFDAAVAIVAETQADFDQLTVKVDELTATAMARGDAKARLAAMKELIATQTKLDALTAQRDAAQAAIKAQAAERVADAQKALDAAIGAFETARKAAIGGMNDESRKAAHKALDAAMDAAIARNIARDAAGIKARVSGGAAKERAKGLVANVNAAGDSIQYVGKVNAAAFDEALANVPGIKGIGHDTSWGAAKDSFGARKYTTPKASFDAAIAAIRPLTSSADAGLAKAASKYIARLDHIQAGGQTNLV